MGCKLSQKFEDAISVYRMEDGDIAIIVSSNIRAHEREVVQRFGSTLITLGKPHGHAWTDLFAESANPKGPMRVRILKPNTLLEITDEDD